jgi:hypothetical protein
LTVHLSDHQVQQQDRSEHGAEDRQGSGQERIGKRIKRMGGTDFIQVTIKMDGK